MEIRKKATFHQVINNPIIYSKTLLTTERRLTGWQVLAVDLSSTFFNTGTTDTTFRQSGKQDSFRHIQNSSASMYDLFNRLGSYRNMQFQISSRRENRQRDTHVIKISVQVFSKQFYFIRSRTFKKKELLLLMFLL